MVAKFLEGCAALTMSPRQIFPLILYLNLKPLYSYLGGETTLADPLIKSPTYEVFLWKPLYKWNVWSHLTVVPSLTESQVCFFITFYIFFFLVQTLVPLGVYCCFTKSWLRIKNEMSAFLNKLKDLYWS